MSLPACSPPEYEMASFPPLDLHDGNHVVMAGSPHLIEETPSHTSTRRQRTSLTLGLGEGHPHVEEEHAGVSAMGTSLNYLFASMSANSVIAGGDIRSHMEPTVPGVDVTPTTRVPRGPPRTLFDSRLDVFLHLKALALPLIATQYNFVLLPMLAIIFASKWSATVYTESEMSNGAVAVLLTCTSVGSAFYLLSGFVFIGGITNAADVLVANSNADVAERLEKRIEESFYQQCDVPMRDPCTCADDDSAKYDVCVTELMHQVIPSTHTFCMSLANSVTGNPVGDISPSHGRKPRSRITSPLVLSSSETFDDKKGGEGGGGFGAAAAAATSKRTPLPPLPTTAITSNPVTLAALETAEMEALKEATEAARATTYSTFLSSVVSSLLVIVLCVSFWFLVSQNLVESLFVARIHGGVYAALAFAPLLFGAQALIPSLTKFFQYNQAIDAALEASNGARGPSMDQRDGVEVGSSSFNSRHDLNSSQNTEHCVESPHDKKKGHHLVVEKVKAWLCSRSPIALAALTSLSLSPLIFLTVFGIVTSASCPLSAAGVVQVLFQHVATGHEEKATMQLVAAVMLSQATTAAVECVVLFLCMAKQRAKSLDFLTEGDSPVNLKNNRRRAPPAKEPPHLEKVRMRWASWGIHDLTRFWAVASVTLVTFLAEAWVVETYMLLAPTMHCDPVLSGGFVVAMNLAFIFFPFAVGLSNATATLLATIPPTTADRQIKYLGHVIECAFASWAVLVSVVVTLICTVGPIALRWLVGTGNSVSGERALDYGKSCLYVVAAFHAVDSLQYVCQCIFRGLRWAKSLLIINTISQWVIGIPVSLVLLAAACPDSPITLLTDHVLPSVAQIPLLRTLFNANVRERRIVLNNATFNGGPDVAVLGYIWSLLLVEIPCFAIILALHIRRLRQQANRFSGSPAGVFSPVVDEKTRLMPTKGPVGAAPPFDPLHAGEAGPPVVSYGTLES